MSRLIMAIVRVTIWVVGLLTYVLSLPEPSKDKLETIPCDVKRCKV